MTETEKQLCDLIVGVFAGEVLTVMILFTIGLIGAGIYVIYKILEWFGFF